MTTHEQTESGRLVAELHAKRPDLAGPGCECTTCTDRTVRPGETFDQWRRRVRTEAT